MIAVSGIVRVTGTGVAVVTATVVVMLVHAVTGARTAIGCSSSRACLRQCRLHRVHTARTAVAGRLEGGAYGGRSIWRAEHMEGRAYGERPHR